MDCLFCKIVNKEVPAEVIYEDDFVLAFLDIQPRTLGHTLVIPKKHRESLIELEDKEIEQFFSGLKNVTLLLKQKLSANGFNIGVNQGKVAGQVISHLHFHILPRFENDNGSSIQAIVNNPPQLSLKEVKKKILG